MSTRTLILPIGGGLDPTEYYTKGQVDQLLSAKEDSADLATVAESGSYNDLTNKPNYGASLSMTIDSQTFVLTAQLKDQNGNNLGSAQTVDLPLESVVVSGSYDAQTKKVILTLQNGSTIEFSVADLVSGLQTEITAQNPLNADLLTDGTTNKVFTATEQSKLSGIEAGAQVNVKPDWNAASGTAAEILNKPVIPAAQVQADWNEADDTAVDYIKNKPAIPAAQVNSDWNASSGVAEILNKPTIPTVNDATVTIRQTGQADQTFTLNQSSNATIDIAAGGGGSDWFGTQAQFDAIQQKDADTNYFISGKLDYNTDLNNTPNLSSYATKSEVQTADATLEGKIAGKMSGNFMTEQEFAQITPKEGDNYFIQGQTVAMTFTLAGGSTVTYNVVVD